jgi:hypothetical protein
MELLAGPLCMVFYGGAIGWTSYWDGNLGRAYPGCKHGLGILERRRFRRSIVTAELELTLFKTRPDRYCGCVPSDVTSLTTQEACS